MAKYYVESGSLRMAVQADTARGAAIWAVHRTMGKLMPFLADESETIHRDVRLASEIRTSEQGFGRSDAQTHDTFEVVHEWNRLLVALDRLHDAAAQEATAV